MSSTGSDDCPAIVKTVEPKVGMAALQRAAGFASTSPAVPQSLRETINREAFNARKAAEKDLKRGRDSRLVAGPALAILLDPALGSLAGEQRDARLRQILLKTRPAPGRVIHRRVIQIVIALWLVGFVALVVFGRGLTPMVVIPLIGMPMLWIGWPREDLLLGLVEARQLAAFANGERESAATAEIELESEATPAKPLIDDVADAIDSWVKNQQHFPSRHLTVADARQAVDDLLAEWGKYQLDIEAWYVTKPLLHDTTGTVATTVAYERAMRTLIAVVDELPDDAPQNRIDAALKLADAAWEAWHAADEYAAETGLGDRSPSERAALQRLGRLVERLTRSSAADPELPMIKRSIQDCLDRITTVSASWADIATLPAIEAAGVLPQIPAGIQPR